MNTTKHALLRCKHRGIRGDILGIIENFGRTAYAPGGATKIFFGNKEYEQAIREIKKTIKLLERAKGGTLIMAEDNILTVYRF